MKMEKEELKELIERAIKQLLEKDSYLLQHDVNERTITHKLAMYIEDISRNIEGFNWDIDVEYNRNYDEPKKIGLVYECVPNTDTEARSVFPDIIIHKRRGNNDGEIKDNNLLVIEIKKDAKGKKTEKDKDINKIKAFLSQSPYYYKYGMFINFITGNNLSFEIE